MARLVSKYRAVVTTKRIAHPGNKEHDLPVIRETDRGPWRQQREHAEEDMRRMADSADFGEGYFEERWVKDSGAPA